MKKIISIVLMLCILTSCQTPQSTETSSQPPAAQAEVSAGAAEAEQAAPEETTQTSAPAEPEAPPEIMDLSSAELSEQVHVDQLGYRLNDVKKAVLAEGDTEFSVVRVSDGAVVFTGTSGDAYTDLASLDTVRVAEFTDVKDEGEYVVATGSGLSYPFTIGDNAYEGLRFALLNMLNYQKCGVEMDLGVWAHEACHAEPALIYGSDGVYKDVSGGWHDAGDYGRYIVPAAQTVADILLGYELSPNPDAEVLDIAWFEIEWMLKMQDEETGGVYHKVSCRSFNALNQMPQDETGELVISPISITATADFAATMAMAARFYPDKKDELLAASVKAYDYAVANQDMPGFRNPSGVSTGEYGDGYNKDELFWAACELYATTGEEKYHEDIKAGNIHSGLGWADMGTFGMAAYLMHAKDFEADDGLLLRMKNKLLGDCQGIMKNYETDPYGTSLGTNYYWGSNMGVGNNAMSLLLYSRTIEETPEYELAALEHMRYLLGRNSISQGYITGFGENAAKNPHHRPSVAVGEAVPGMVVGGPNQSTGDDPTLRSNREGYPPAKCYVDHQDSYASNEITIYWNSPVYFVMAALGL
ncbi:MAG: glycoside hydrolase family 9 protein [Clostridiales bacterium]|jgi:endoglucanase|nr:glycoside hydrolase family 9 protein [Clostridiales bacterium]